MKKGFLAFVVIAILFSTSCKKDEEKNITIVGKWTLSEQGWDNNHNNKIDPGETYTSTTGLGAFIGFMYLETDNTYSTSHSWAGRPEFSSTGTYTYATNVLTMVDDSGTNSLTVMSLSSNKLIVRSTLDLNPAWKIYTR
ncbi:MAG TPA: lipocalin family protein [Pedobacter sp.]|jgi:hypothetical protein